jgi:hypothetical protein
MRDLNLAGCLPAEVQESATHISGATSVDEIALSEVSDDDRGPKGHLEPKGRDQTVNNIDGGIGTASLDLVDIRRAHTNRCRELSLRSPKRSPTVPAEPGQ